MFKEHESFRLTKALPNESIPTGTFGVVLMVFASSSSTYLVEFPDDKGGNLGNNDFTFTITEDFMGKDNR